MRLKTFGVLAFVLLGIAWLLMRPLVLLLREEAPREHD